MGVEMMADYEEIEIMIHSEKMKVTEIKLTVTKDNNQCVLGYPRLNLRYPGVANGRNFSSTPRTKVTTTAQ